MLKIVPMEHKHVQDIMEIENTSFSVPWEKQSFINELSNNMAVYYVALWGEKAVGYGGMWCVSGEGQITNIAVLKDYRRKKIGEQILNFLINEAKNKHLDVLMLELRKSNLPALSLYEKAGFIKVGERPFYYTNPKENAILMNKKIGDNICQ